MGHLEIERGKYPELLMALASDLKVLSEMGVDKAMVKRINAELRTVGGDMLELFRKYGGYGHSKVKIGYHHHLLSGRTLVVDSGERQMFERAA